MKWSKSEVAPKVCALLHDGDVLVGIVEYDKFARAKWRAVIAPSYNTVGRRQSKREAMRLVEDHYRGENDGPAPRLR